jgi:hypothetical protein
MPSGPRIAHEFYGVNQPQGQDIRTIGVLALVISFYRRGGSSSGPLNYRLHLAPGYPRTRFSDFQPRSPTSSVSRSSLERWRAPRAMIFQNCGLRETSFDARPRGPTKYLHGRLYGGL